MGIFDRLTAAFDTLRGSGAPARGDDPRTTRPFTPLPYDALTTVTVAQARRTLESHEAGQFVDSARLFEHLLRDADVQQALKQRVLGVAGLPFKLDPADDSPAARAEADALAPHWDRIVPPAAQADMIRGAAVLGFAVGQLVWTWDEDLGALLPVLEPWPAAYVDHLPWDRTWWATAAEGRVQITPGDGRWVLFTPESAARPHMYGAVRCLPDWFLRAMYVARDWGRWSEVHGQGTWIAKLPAGQRETPDGKWFLESIRGLGRAGVIPVPQSSTPGSGYDVDLKESISKGEGFDALLEKAARKIRLALLGQDMTSQSGADGGAYAQSKVGNQVRWDVKAADAQAWGACLRVQVLRPRARYQTGRAALAARACWNTDPPEDRTAKANALSVAGDAIAKWQRAGWDVDVQQLATQFGVPGKLAPKPAAPRATTPPGAEPADDGDDEPDPTDPTEPDEQQEPDDDAPPA